MAMAGEDKEGTLPLSPRIIAVVMMRMRARAMATVIGEGKVEVPLSHQPCHRNIVMRTRRERAMVRVRTAHRPCYVASTWLSRRGRG